MSSSLSLFSPATKLLRQQMIRRLFMFMCLLAAAVSAHAQPPTTTTAPARHVVTVPPGFQTIIVRGQTLMVEPADAAWVRQATADLKPLTMPSTMPADLLSHFDANRAKLAAQMSGDLAIADPKTVEQFFDEKLRPMLARFAQLHPPLLYLVTTQPRLKQLMQNGWSDPRVYYNRAADKVEISGVLSLSIVGEADDVLLPVIYEPSDSQEKKMQQLSDEMRISQSSLTQTIADRSIALTQVAFVGFIARQTIEPLKLKPDQEWLGVGLVGVYSAKYSSPLTGTDTAGLMQSMASDDPRNPLRSETIDLLHPTPRDQMRPVAVFAYDDAFRRKSTRVLEKWLKSASEADVPKLLVALRQNPPSDGAALLKQIQQISGVDLTAEMGVGK
jgi:hypothetical protein